MGTPWRPLIGVVMALVLGAMIATQGCATANRSSQAAPTQTSADTMNASPSSDASANPNTSSANEAPSSVAGATSHAVGTIILFPFRLTADALGLIF